MKGVEKNLGELINLIRELPEEGYGMITRAWVAFQLEYHRILIFDNHEDPKTQLINIINNLIEIVKSSKNLLVGPVINFSKNKNLFSKELIEQFTHNLYGDLWINFSLEQYEEATNLLKERLTKNDVDLSIIKDKVVLDAGCGSGRYTVALAKLGAKKAVGVDIGTKGMGFAKTKIKELKLDNIEFKEGNVLEIPFEDNTFDFAFSNGVIHHTINVEKALSELARVLKPKGYLWIFVQGKGGLQWMVTDVCREILKIVPREFTQQLMMLNGIPQNRIFYMMDPLYVPIQAWQEKDEFEKMLKKYNLSDFRRLIRGVKFDGIEKITNKEPFAEEKYGTAELKYLARKDI